MAVGKVKEKYLLAGIREYEKRLKPFVKLEIIEVKEEAAPEKLSPAEKMEVLSREGEAIKSKIIPGSLIVPLEREGKELTSEELASYISKQGTEGQSQITFVIGGSLGIDRTILNRGSIRLSFSKLTFPHQLFRLILMEQIYRTFTIIQGHPYHK